jgi:rhamnogalacturonan endolyase
MKSPRFRRPGPYLIKSAARAAFCFLFLSAAIGSLRADGVTVREERSAVYLSNGLVEVGINKSTGELVSLREGNGPSVLGTGHMGYLTLTWRYLHAGPKDPPHYIGTHPVFRVVSDTPDLGEVSFDWQAGPDQPFDLDLRLMMRPGASGFYVAEIIHNPAGAPDSQIEECTWKMRFADALFNYRYLHPLLQGPLVSSSETAALHADPAVNLMNETFRMPNGDIWAKHQWCMNEKLSPVYGLTGAHVGAWDIMPSYESFGSVRPHNDCNAVHETVDGPIILMSFENNYYGRGPLPVTAGFVKYNGPLFVYLNQGVDRDAMWADARREAAAQAAQWPYAWLHDPLYPLQRGTVTGRFQITDGSSAAGAWAILGDPDTDWQSHSCPYLFFVKADASGQFTLPEVRAGTYTLYAWVRGVYGELRRDGVSVEAGKTTDLGTLTWTPVTHGKFLWQIGTPDRDAREFAGADTLQGPGELRPHWNNFLRYHTMFPHDVDFTIGKSDEHKNWFYMQPAGLIDDPRYYEVQPPAPPLQDQKPIAWNIHFNLPKVPGKEGVLTLAFCSVRDTTLLVQVNGTQVAAISFPYVDSDSIGIRAGVYGLWRQRIVDIKPGLLHPGMNTITLVHSRAYWLHYVMYDFLRFETVD